MNNLKTDINGGFPFTLNDLRFVNAAQMEAFVGVIKAMIGNLPYAILQGCQYSVNPDGTGHINEGYVYFDNEIFYAPAQDVASQTSGGYFWDVVITYDHSGDKGFEIDGTVHPTYEVRRATLNYYSTGTEGMRPPMQADNIVTILQNRLSIDANISWSEMVLDSSNVSIGSTGSLSTIIGKLYYKVIGKTVFLRVSLTTLTIASGDSNTKMIKIMLPPGLTPRGTTGIVSNIIIETDFTVTLGVHYFNLSAYSDQLYLSIIPILNDYFAVRSYQLSGELFYEIN